MDPEVVIKAILQKSVSIPQLFDKTTSTLEFTIEGEYNEETRKFIPHEMSAMCTGESDSISDDVLNQTINDELAKSIACTHDFVEISTEIAGYAKDKQMIYQKTMQCVICGLYIILNEPKRKIRYTPVEFSFGGLIKKRAFFDTEEYRYVSTL